MRRHTALIVLVVLVAGVVPSLPAAAQDGGHEADVEVVASGLRTPWSIAFTSDGRVFVAERDSGVVSELVDGEPEPVQQLGVDSAGEGGLLGLAVSPDFANDGLLYAYLTTASDNRIVRFRPGGSVDTVLSGIPAASIHNGGRIAFGPDGMLYAGTGDASQASLAQDKASLAGKILRLTPDGEIPDDNPFGTLVWSVGHRNVQGLAWDANGRLFATEFGPDRDDEVNRIVPGRNYGWPNATGATGGDRYTDPVFVRQPSEASWSGATILARGAIPEWEGDLFLAALRGRRLWRVALNADGAVTASESLLVGEYGRLRLAAEAPDGSLWLSTSNRDGRGDPAADDDRILRLTMTGDPLLGDACPPDAIPPAGFTDVNPSSVHAASVDCIVAYGITQGVTSRRYEPAATVSRAQMASLLLRTLDAAGVDLPAVSDQGFTDLGSSVHAAAINRLAQLGVVEGRTSTRYAPAAAVTRGQMASFLARTYAAITGSPLGAGPEAFPDVRGVHTDNVNRVAGAGLARGRADGNFRPDQPVQRDQMASFLARLMGLLVGEGVITPPGGSSS